MEAAVVADQLELVEGRDRKVRQALSDHREIPDLKVRKGLWDHKDFRGRVALMELQAFKARREHRVLLDLVQFPVLLITSQNSPIVPL